MFSVLTQLIAVVNLCVCLSLQIVHVDGLLMTTLTIILKICSPKKLVEFQFVELLSLFNIVLLKGHQMILKHFVFVIWNYIPIIILYNGFYKNSKLIQKCKEYYTNIIWSFFPISTFKILSTFESLLSASVSMLYIIMGHLEVSYLKIFSSNSTLLFSSGSLKFPEHRQIC